MVDTDTENYHSIYCHYDGYIRHTGKLLVENYTTLEAVKQLIDLGAISCLAKHSTPDPTRMHSFEISQNDVTVAYHRDRGEKLLITSSAWLREHAREQYAYLFINDEWVVSQNNGKNWTEVKEYFRPPECIPVQHN